MKLALEREWGAQQVCGLVAGVTCWAEPFLALPRSVSLTIHKLIPWVSCTHRSTLERKEARSHQIGETQ